MLIMMTQLFRNLFSRILLEQYISTTHVRAVRWVKSLRPLHQSNVLCESHGRSENSGFQSFTYKTLLPLFSLIASGFIDISSVYYNKSIENVRVTLFQVLALIIWYLRLPSSLYYVSRVMYFKLYRARRLYSFFHRSFVIANLNGVVFVVI